CAAPATGALADFCLAGDSARRVLLHPGRILRGSSAGIPGLRSVGGDVAARGELLLCPIMVGREATLRHIERGLEAVQDGAGATTLISGEAGIGKTRMLRAVTETARHRGWRILAGACYEERSR